MKTFAHFSIYLLALGDKPEAFHKLEEQSVAELFHPSLCLFYGRASLSWSD